MTLVIPPGERAQIRVFAINRPTAEMTQALKQHPAADIARDLLSAPHLNTASTEVFPMSDLAGVGLTEYLSEGYAVDDTALSVDRPKLDALDGYVLLLFSDSFAGLPATFTPSADVTLIGTYSEARPDMTKHMLKTDAAALYTGPEQEQPPRAKGRIGSAVILAALVFALALWWMLS